MLKSGDYEQGKGRLSYGAGKGRKYSAEALIAEAAILNDVIDPPKFDAERGVWLYGMWGTEHWLPEEVYEWADCPPVGPELIVPGVTLVPMPMLWCGDMGATFAVLAEVLMNSVSE